MPLLVRYGVVVTSEDGDLPGSRTVTCQIPFTTPVSVTGNVSDVGILASIDRTQHYEPDVMIAVHESGLRRDAVCIDGGGNVGLLAMALARFAPDGQIYSFEPGRENGAFLAANLEANHITNVELVALGLWNEAQVLHLQSDEHHPGGAFVSETGDGFTTAEEITTVRLDDWVAERGLDRLDLLKLDIEGAEPFALLGAAETVARFRPLLLVEFNPGAVQRLDPSRSPWDFYRDLTKQFEVISYIREDGTTVDIISKQHLSRVLVRKGYVDLLCRPERRGAKAQLRQWIRSGREMLLLLAQYNPFRPSPQAFLAHPSYEAEVLSRHLRLTSGERAKVGVRIKNTGPIWFNSSYPNHPIHAAYHWADSGGNIVERDGLRTEFPSPLGPMRSATFDIVVLAPEVPGDYTLVFSLVQERFAWADELRPDIAVRVAATVS